MILDDCLKTNLTGNNDKKTSDNRQLEELGEKLEKVGWSAANNRAKKKNGPDDHGKALALALRVGVELVSAVTVGTIIGIAFDYWLLTGPWLMIIFIILGTIAGMLNIYRLASGYNSDRCLNQMVKAENIEPQKDIKKDK